VAEAADGSPVVIGGLVGAVVVEHSVESFVVAAERSVAAVG